nr:sugar phosphate isomerase/epimerase family protein [Candidatus Njordarchaeum guaymaensis]
MIFGFVAFPRKLEDYLQWAADNGFTHIEVDGGIPSNFPDQFSDSRVKSIRELADQLGVTLSYHTSYAVNLADPYKELRNAANNLIRKCIELSEKLGAKWVTVHPGYKIGWPDRKSERVSLFVESLRFLLDVAEKHGLSIAVENLNKLLVGEIFYLGDCFDELNEIFSSSSSSHLKMTLDFGHAHLGEGIERHFKTFADRIVCTHIHDNEGRGADQHLPVGKGSIDWRNVCNVMKRVNYGGPLCFEVDADESKIDGMRIIEHYLKLS